jgi:hypothetical protein
MEVFQEIDSKSFGSYTFLLIIGEIPCSMFQPIIFIDLISSKHMNESFCLGRLHDWLHLMVDYVDLYHITNHLVAWLHWSFKYID